MCHLESAKFLIKMLIVVFRKIHLHLKFWLFYAIKLRLPSFAFITRRYMGCRCSRMRYLKVLSFIFILIVFFVIIFLARIILSFLFIFFLDWVTSRTQLTFPAVLVIFSFRFWVILFIVVKAEVKVMVLVVLPFEEGVQVCEVVHGFVIAGGMCR